MSHPPAAPQLRTGVSPSRRAVLGAAAWSVPAITVAAATPAFAATPGAGAGPASALEVSTAGATMAKNNVGGTRTIKGRVSVDNRTAAATTRLQVIFLVPAAYMPNPMPAVAPPLVSSIGIWTPSGLTATTDPFTVIFDAPAQLAANAKTEIVFELTALMPALDRLTGPAPAVHVMVKDGNKISQAPWVPFIPA